jgi:hypothetical protein
MRNAALKFCPSALGTREAAGGPHSFVPHWYGGSIRRSARHRLTADAKALTQRSAGDACVIFDTLTPVLTAGGLCYFVNLSDHYEGADFFDTLVYDAQRGEVNKVLVAHEQAEFLQVEDVSESKQTVWNDQKKSGEWFIDFLDKAIQAGLERQPRNS